MASGIVYVIMHECYTQGLAHKWVTIGRLILLAQAGMVQSYILPCASPNSALNIPPSPPPPYELFFLPSKPNTHTHTRSHTHVHVHTIKADQRSRLWCYLKLQIHCSKTALGWLYIMNTVSFVTSLLIY